MIRISGFDPNMLLFTPYRCSQQLDLPNKIAFGNGANPCIGFCNFLTLSAASAQSCLNSNLNIIL